MEDAADPDFSPVPAFARWARLQARAVESPEFGEPTRQALRSVIGSAHLVSFGEGLHGAAEPLVFRNRLFRFLVEELGFSAIVIESGVVEGFEANRYVLGEADDLDAVLEHGFSAGFGRLPQNAELLRWMRGWNADPAHPDKIEFHGMDVSGRPEAMQGPLFAALDFLGRLDSVQAQRLRDRMADLVPWLRLDRRSDEPGQYTDLDPAQRDRLTAVVADAVAELAMREADCLGAGMRRDFALALQTAVAARQVDDYLRRLPPGWKPAQGLKGLAGTVAAADRAKADNVDWVRRRLGADARVLLFAHRDHLAGSRSTIRFPPHFDSWTLPPMAGEHLALRHGSDLVTIGHLFAAENLVAEAEGTQAAQASIEAQLARLPHPELLLDLRAAPAMVRQELSTPHELFGVPPFNTTVPAQAWDAMYFTRRVGPAGDLRSAPGGAA